MVLQKKHAKRIIETSNTRYVIHVSSYDTDGVISIYEGTFKSKGKNMNLHYHKRLTETFIILQGSFMFHVEGENLQMEANDTIAVKPMEIHGFRALEPDSKMLITFSDSPNRDDFFVELAEKVINGKPLDNEFYARFDQYYPNVNEIKDSSIP